MYLAYLSYFRVPCLRLGLNLLPVITSLQLEHQIITYDKGAILRTDFSLSLTNYYCKPIFPFLALRSRRFFLFVFSFENQERDQCIRVICIKLTHQLFLSTLFHVRPCARNEVTIPKFTPSQFMSSHASQLQTNRGQTRNKTEQIQDKKKTSPDPALPAPYNRVTQLGLMGTLRNIGSNANREQKSPAPCKYEYIPI